MRVMLTSAEIRKQIEYAILAVIGANKQYQETLEFYNPQETDQKFVDENNEMIAKIDRDNAILQKWVETIRSIPKYNVGVLRSKMCELWFDKTVTIDKNVSFEQKLISLGIIDCIIKLGFTKVE